MRFRKSILLLTALAVIGTLVGCSSSNNSTTTPPVISVSLAGAPASLQISTTAALTATVSNDSNNAGVTWTVSCGSSGTGACGAISNATTTSATYTAPAAIPTGASVTVTATSVADNTKSASAVITITSASGVTVALAGEPASLQINGTASLTATVTNDSKNAGVTWSVACGSSTAGACGALSNTTTTTATYTAPAAVPPGVTVTVTATSITDTTASASTSSTIVTASPTLSDGTYVFSLSGEDQIALTGGTCGTNVACGPYFAAGAFVVSGGAITGGEQDFISFSVSPVTDSITGGSVTTTADGNLQITLTTSDVNVGVNGTETLDATLISSTRARVIEFDSNATSSGRFDLQTTPVPVPSGGYAFFVNGFDGNTTAVAPQAIGGVLDLDGAGNVVVAGSIFDINDGGSILQDQPFTSGTVSPTPDSFGRITFTLAPSGGVLGFNLVGYIVDPTHIRLVETTDTMNGTMAGLAFGQGTNTGTFSSIASNTYVIGLRGFETSFSILQTVGMFTMNSNGTVSGFINYNDLSGTGPQTPSPITSGTYTVDSTGRVTMTGVTDGIASFTTQFYLTGQGSEAEVTSVSMDTGDVLGGQGLLQSGGGSFTASSLSGSYAMDVTGADSTNEFELDAVGPITADGVSAFVGSADLNWLLNSGPTSNLGVTGTFTAASSGAFTGTIGGLDVNGSTDTFVYYMVDTTKTFVLETDTNQLTYGFFSLEQ